MRGCINGHGLMRHLRRAALAQALAALLGALPVLANLFLARHEATVQHVYCAEHGELSHVAASPVPTRTARPAPARDSEVRARSADDHEHCSALSDCLGAEGRIARQTAVRVPPRPADDGGIVRPLPRSGRGVVLAAAPKTSPPRVG